MVVTYSSSLVVGSSAIYPSVQQAVSDACLLGMG